MSRSDHIQSALDHMDCDYNPDPDDDADLDLFAASPYLISMADANAMAAAIMKNYGSAVGNFNKNIGKAFDQIKKNFEGAHSRMVIYDEIHCPQATKPPPKPNLNKNGPRHDQFARGGKGKKKRR